MKEDFPTRPSTGSRLRTFTSLTWYEETTGRVDVDLIPLDEGAEVDLCGPVPFMQHIRAGLHRRGVPDATIRYEVFGSEQWQPAPVAA